MATANEKKTPSIEHKDESGLSWFARFAHFTSKWAGKPVTSLR